MAKWGKIGGRGRGRWAQNVRDFASLRIEKGELAVGVYFSLHPITIEVEEAVQVLMDGERIVNVPNSLKFVDAAKALYAATLAAQANAVPAEVQP
jgi:hypothetical protein